MQQIFGGIKYKDPQTGNYIELSGLTGLQGETPLLRKGQNAIEVSYDNGTTWTTLIPFSDLVYYTVDNTFSMVSTNPLQNNIITKALTPISETEYENLTVKDKPLYFIYDEMKP